MKLCSKCGILKDTSDFSKMSKAKDGLQSMCKLCFKDNDRRRWLDDSTREKRLEQKREVIRSNYERYFELKQSVSCVDCGIQDYRIIDFDHTEGNKLDNVSSMIRNFGWDRIMEEVSKCEPVCANCHRIRTYERQARSKYHPSVTQLFAGTNHC